MDHVEANKNSRPLKLHGMIQQKYSIEEVTKYVTENGYVEINLTVIVSAISNENLDIASYLFEQLQSKLSKDNRKITKKDLIPHVQKCSNLNSLFLFDTDFQQDPLSGYIPFHLDLYNLA